MRFVPFHPLFLIFPPLHTTFLFTTHFFIAHPHLNSTLLVNAMSREFNYKLSHEESVSHPTRAIHLPFPRRPLDALLQRSTH